MLTFLFFAALIYVAWKLLVLGFKATWSILKIVCAVILFPAFLVVLVSAGLIYIAIPILIVAGIIAIVKSASA